MQERAYYLIESVNDSTLERIWAWVQSTNEHILMYKTRLNKSTTGWIVDSPRDKMLTAFLLNFGNYVTSVSKPNYYM